MTTKEAAPLAFPSPAFAETTVRPGEVAVIEGVDVDGDRHVVVAAAIRPKP